MKIKLDIDDTIFDELQKRFEGDNENDPYNHINIKKQVVERFLFLQNNRDVLKEFIEDIMNY